MRIFTDGARCPSCQLNRIDRGFIKLGHKIVTDITKADLIYSNNPWYDDIIGFVKRPLTSIHLQDNNKVIFNILDLAPHLGDQFDISRLKKCLEYTDATTCISETVQLDCKNRLGITPHVIYNPIMDIYKEKNSKSRKFRFLMTGRLRDPNKRASLTIEALMALGVKPEEVAFCGTEYPGFGTNLGVVEIEELRALYNEVDFVMVTSHHEGLGLQVPEAMAAGAIPVVCNDLTTRQEFLPSNIFSEYDDVYPNAISIVHFISRYMDSYEKMLDLKNKIYFYYKAKLADKFSDVGVAKAIINVYNSL